MCMHICTLIRIVMWGQSMAFDGDVSCSVFDSPSEGTRDTRGHRDRQPQLRSEDLATTRECPRQNEVCVERDDVEA